MTDTDIAGDPQAAVLEGITKSQAEALHSIEKANAALVQGLHGWTNEMANFFAGRIEEDLKTQQDLLRCQNLEDIRLVQARFFSQAFDQYAKETSQLLRLGGEVFAKTVQPAGDR
jgi:hypothetical protein